MQLNVLRLDVATAAAEAEQQLRSTNRNAVAAFSPALADAVVAVCKQPCWACRAEAVRRRVTPGK
jgi:hypothetical protein